MSKLLGYRDNYSERSPMWYRQRLAVFVPHPEKESQDANRALSLEDAFKALVQVIEAPFDDRDSRLYAPMTHFILRTQVGAQNHEPSYIRNNIDRTSRELGITFEGRILETQTLDARTSGFFTGNSLFIPETVDETPRGRISLYLYAPPEENGKQEVTEWEVVFANTSGSFPAGLYLGQDRICFGTSPAMPAHLRWRHVHLIDQNGAPWIEDDNGAPETVNAQDLSTLLAPNRICCVLPPTASGASDDSTNIFFTTLCPEARRIISGEEKATQNTPVSLIWEPEPDDKSSQWITPPPSRPDPATGAIEVDVTTSLLQTSAQTQQYEAILRIAPNTAYSRLRRSPDALTQGRFEVLGIVLPSPSGMPQLRETVLNFQSAEHLLADDLQAHKQSVLLRPKPYPLSTPRDHVATADSMGELWEDPFFVDDATASKIGTRHRVQMISTHSVFNLGTHPEKVLHVVDKMQGEFPGGSFAYLWCQAAHHNFGWFGVPLPHSCLRHDDPEDVPVTFRRSGQGDPSQEVCLDWLDIAAKVVLEERANKLELAGYAQFWEDVVRNEYENVADHQYFSMRGVGEGRKALHYVERIRGEELPVRLKAGSCIRIGPLIARYSHIEKGDTP
ncbi:hypothetical protein [Tropicibacter naphthalenivorans]|nr:hypothetical protein [Tropicibacter naphthalenivorans]